MANFTRRLRYGPVLGEASLHLGGNTVLLPRVVVYVEEHRVSLALYRLNQGNQILVLSPSSRRMIKGLLVSSFHQFKKSVEVNYEPEKKSFLSVSFKKKKKKKT